MTTTTSQAVAIPRDGSSRRDRRQGSGTPSRAVTGWTVVDASVLAVALADDGPDGDRVRARLAGTRLVAPATIDLEVLAVWHRGTLSGAVPARRVDLAVADLIRIRLERVSPARILPLCWELLPRVTPADAAYVALAEALDAPLLTADPRLADRCPSRVRVEVLG